MDLLLLSSSRDASGQYLTHAMSELRASLAAAREVWFVPFAGVTVSWNDYTTRVREALASLGVTIRSVHDAPDPAAAIRDARAVMVGGGNTFHLLRELQRTGLLEGIRERVRAGIPYVGWSAGSVVCGPTIRTTNDMPIVEPMSPAALGFVPFHINGHFTDEIPAKWQGETREQRLEEFLTVHPETSVLGLREGAMLRVSGSMATILGEPGAVVIAAGRPRVELRKGDRIDALLRDARAEIPAKR